MVFVFSLVHGGGVCAPHEYEETDGAALWRRHYPFSDKDEKSPCHQVGMPGNSKLLLSNHEKGAVVFELQTGSFVFVLCLAFI